MRLRLPSRARKAPPTFLPAAARAQRRDCHGRLEVALLALAGPSASIAEHGMTPWCSATFVGARHELRLRLAGADAAARAAWLAATLPEAEFAVPGHLVADCRPGAIVAMGDDRLLPLEILTIEEW